MAAPIAKTLRHRLRIIAKWNAEAEAQAEAEDRMKEQYS
jgi:hypothetical protein